MGERIILLALLPYALLLVWSLRKLKFSEVSIALLGLTTMAVVWGVLYASFSLVIFPPDPSRAFAPVEHIARDSQWEWLLRYVAEVFGWFIGLLFFFACWGIAWLWSSRKPRAP